MLLDTSLSEHDIITLVDDLPEFYLYKGDRGVIVHIYSNFSDFEVEFSKDYFTTKVVTLKRFQFRIETK